MAYTGDTACLCQAIVDGDLEHVEDWCSQQDVDLNRRDYTGRTPLHLAVMASTPEIVQCLINHGARLVSRLVDGRTALHIAAARGNVQMVRALMNQSLANGEDEEEKIQARRTARKTGDVLGDNDDVDSCEGGDDLDCSAITLGSVANSDSMTMGSFVKVDEKDKRDAEVGFRDHLPIPLSELANTGGQDGIVEDSGEDPDVYDIDVIAWDYGLSPLHLAILNGHVDVVDLLVSEYGADVLLPVKLIQPGTNNARGAIFTLVLATSLPCEQARKMVRLLLKLGATPAQGDMNHVTALHHIVADNNNEVLDILLEEDRPASLSVLSNRGFRPSSWYFGGDDGASPLTTAVGKGYQEMVSKLLSFGAKPTISFDDFIKGYIENYEQARNSTPEHNMKKYLSNVTQPIIAAAAKELGLSIEELLAHGADANTLDKHAYSILRDPRSALHLTGESILDIVQKKLKVLREYKGEEKNNFQREPETLRDEKFYTCGLVDSSYQYWTALCDYQSAKKKNLAAYALYNESMKKKAIEGEKEKKEAIKKLIQEFESAEKALLAAGAKTFSELHSGLPKPQGNKVHHQHKENDPLPYETKMTFQIPDLNDTKKTGYLLLFEAAWKNDIDTIKSLTLAPWECPDSPGHTPPLKVAVKDGNGFSPFSIAVLRGHWDLARKIVDICIAQYYKDDGITKRQRWNLLPSQSDDGESEDGESLPIFSELISDKSTVDNLGEVSNLVKSDVMPLQMIEWTCLAKRFKNSNQRNDHQLTLLEYAVKINDIDLLEFMIQLGSEQQSLLAKEEDDQKSYNLSRAVFQEAIKLGRTEMLGHMIKTTGAGIPLNELIIKSGIEPKTKPKYYQGLTVGGRKRADWARAPNSQIQVVEERITPALQAAMAGNVESVDWFMSDEPMRQYKEFAVANQQDKRIRTLDESGIGFESTIGKWLNAKSKTDPLFMNRSKILQASLYFTARFSTAHQMNKACPNTLL
jgi:ankyrin repeat protein